MAGSCENIAPRKDYRIPVARPRLPRLDQIAPYIKSIDQSRNYSNGGALCGELEARLAAKGGGGASVAAVCNATTGLTIALQIGQVVPGTYCAVPAWTFAATAHAIRLAGLIPWIVDVDTATWTLDPEFLRDELQRAPGRVTAAVPVAPFGSPVDPAPWEAFQQDTGIKVVIDAAAAFDSVRASSLPAVVSLHATKALGVGEGGYVLWTQANLTNEVRKRANFGFGGGREATVAGLNGKLSEYSAAIGLAALDAWDETRAEWARVAKTYETGLFGSGVALQRGSGQDWVASTVTARIPFGRLETLEKILEANDVGSCRWWGLGLHRQAAFSGFPRAPTPNADVLADCVLGLPCWVDLSNEQIVQICGLVKSAI